MNQEQPDQAPTGSENAEADTPDSPDLETGTGATTDADAGGEADGSEEAGEVLVSYEHDQRGHRITRRTVRRREVTEDTEETITDSYPVPHQPPAPAGHPAPVG